MNYKTARIKQTLEQILLSPFILLGKIIGRFYCVDNPSGIFLIYPRYDAGGSMKVNADITKIIAEKKPLILFTKNPKDGKFRNLYSIEGVSVLDIANQIDNKYYHFLNAIWRGILSIWINKHKAPIVFGGEAIYFYKLLPYLRKETKKIEIIHVNKWMNYNQAFVPFIDLRIFTAKKIMADYEHHYDVSGVPSLYKERLTFIENYVDIPVYKRPSNQYIRVLFVGRNSPQKRPHLAFKVAEEVIKLNSHIQFTFVGDLHEFENGAHSQITILTHIRTQEQLQKLYEEHDVLLMTSKFEGLPLVVMDMMANGRIVVSTAVDGLRDNVVHLWSGMLMEELEDEKIIVAEATRILIELNMNQALRVKLSENARSHAEKHFGYKAFHDSYLHVFSRK